LPTAESFGREYEAAAELMRARKWKQAREAWLVLLRRHAGMDYVRPRTAEIREDLRKSAFWIVNKEPRPEDVVTGDLYEYSPASGSLRIGYQDASLGDFQSVTGPGPILHLHPVRFRGPYTIELEGDRNQLRNVSLYVALDRQGRGFLVQLGAHLSTLYYQHRLLRLADGESVVLVEREPKATSRTTIRARLRVDPDAITLTYDGERIFRAKNELGLGQWGLSRTGPFGKLVLDGVAESSWMTVSRTHASKAPAKRSSGPTRIPSSSRSGRTRARRRAPRSASGCCSRASRCRGSTPRPRSSCSSTWRPCERRGKPARQPTS
jgi:hypothetical protein